MIFLSFLFCFCFSLFMFITFGSIMSRLSARHTHFPVATYECRTATQKERKLFVMKTCIISFHLIFPSSYSKFQDNFISTRSTATLCSCSITISIRFNAFIWINCLCRFCFYFIFVFFSSRIHMGRTLIFYAIKKARENMFLLYIFSRYEVLIDTNDSIGDNFSK